MNTDKAPRLIFVTFAAIAFALGALTVRQPALPMYIGGATLGVLLFWGRPKLSLIAWLSALAFIPYWAGANTVGYMPAASLVGLLILAANAPSSKWKLHKADLVILLLILVGLVAVTVSESSQGVWFSMMTQWLLAYLVGKTVIPAAGARFSMKAIAVVFGLVGVLASAELAFSWHPFVDLVVSNQPYQTWSPIQFRGGIGRSEWAMGHSIALGGVLAMTIPFILRAAVGAFAKAVLLLAVFAGIACTFSRAAIISAVLTLALTLIFMREVRPGARIVLLIFGGVAGVMGIKVLAPIFEAASQETAGSSSYRLRMLEELIPGMSMVGRSRLAVDTGGGSIQYGFFKSIDSTFLGIGLGFGWVAALLVLIPFVIMIARMLRRRATTAEIALVGQLPLLFTVALITQYQMVLWFAAGIAVAESVKVVAGRKSLPATTFGDYAGATPTAPASLTVNR